MKRSALLFSALLVGAASVANAQGLTMQMSNGWSFSFAGNVNAFIIYGQNKGSATVDGGLIGTDDKATRIRAGLLPAAATFEARGKEGNTDLGVHFGFFPQIQCTAPAHDCFGAQIDMRQVFLTVGGKWGQILAGRELGLFNRQNILTDQALFGAGPQAFTLNGGGTGGTTLGRIGLGYIYPNFNAQMTYSTPGGRPGQLSIGLFDPSGLAGGGPISYGVTKAPRVEVEGTYTLSSVKLWASGTINNASTAASGGTSKTATGVGGGFKWSGSGFALVGSGYYGKGIGTTFQFNDVGGGTISKAVDNVGELRKSFGYIGQLNYTPSGGKVTLSGSYGDSRVKQSADDKATSNGTLVKSNSAIIGTVVYQATKSLKVVWEYDHAEAKNHAGQKNKQDQGAFGLMVFF